MKQIAHRALLLTLVLTVALGCHRQQSEEAPAAAPAAGEKNMVELGAEALKHAGIEVQDVTEQSVAIPLVAPGRISFDMNHTGRVTSTLDGRIVQMNYDIGQMVKKGDVTALIDAPELLHPLELKAPMAGRVVERNGTVGDLLDRTQSLYTIAETTTLWCIAAVNESDIGAVRVGQPASITVLSYPDESFAGKVVRVSDAVNEQTRTVEVRIVVENPRDILKAGMFANAALRTAAVTKGLFVPDGALQTIGERPVVFVEEKPGTYHATIVRLGREIGTQHEVLDGLAAGARVVTSGSFILKSELLKSELEED